MGGILMDIAKKQEIISIFFATYFTVVLCKFKSENLQMQMNFSTAPHWPGEISATPAKRVKIQNATSASLCIFACTTILFSANYF
jgi:hypothetical protein